MRCPHTREETSTSLPRDISTKITPLRKSSSNTHLLKQSFSASVALLGAACSRGRGSPGYCGVLSSSAGLFPPDASRIQHCILVCDNPKCFQAALGTELLCGGSVGSGDYY